MDPSVQLMPISYGIEEFKPDFTLEIKRSNNEFMFRMLTRQIDDAFESKDQRTDDEISLQKSFKQTVVELRALDYVDCLVKINMRLMFTCIRDELSPINCSAKMDADHIQLTLKFVRFNLGLMRAHVEKIAKLKTDVEATHVDMSGSLAFIFGQRLVPMIKCMTENCKTHLENAEDLEREWMHVSDFKFSG